MGPKKKAGNRQAQDEAASGTAAKRDRNDSAPEYGELLLPQYLRLRPKLLSRTIVESKDRGKVTYRCAALDLIHVKAELPMAYVALACSMDPREAVTLNDGVATITKMECCLKALEISPMHPIALVQLGDSLDASGHPLVPILSPPARINALVNNKLVTRQECYLLAINCDPTLASAYCGLGNTLVGGNMISDSKARVVLMDGTVLKHAQCFLRAIELDPLYSLPVFSLFRAVSKIKAYTLPSGKTVQGALGLIEEAFRLDPTNSTLLQYIKTFGGSFQLPDGRVLKTANEIALEALRIEPDNPRNYLLLMFKFFEYFAKVVSVPPLADKWEAAWATPPAEMAVTLDDGRVVTNSEDCMKCMFESIGDTREAYECLEVCFILHFQLPEDRKTITLKDGRVISEAQCRSHLKAC